MPGQIITFYSYKGGTGRTMAVANVAWIMASQGKRVLIVDWDLEAPGLHRYFAPFLSDPLFRETDGLMDFLIEYVKAASRESPKGLEDSVQKNGWIDRFADISDYTEPVRWQFEDGGGIDLVAAGRQDSEYGTRVNHFDWIRFYQSFGGSAFLESAFEQIVQTYDYVLIDSRTGISDTSGICTVQLPHVLVVLFTLNHQSIEGASQIVGDVINQRKGRMLRVLPVATRIELREKPQLEAQRALFRQRFSGFLPADQKADSYWSRMEILYDSFYAYGEVLATLGDSPGNDNSVLAACERLTKLITNNEIKALKPISDAKRIEAMRRYNATAESSIGYRPTETSVDVFISGVMDGLDGRIASSLYHRMKTFCDVFWADKSVQAGQDWIVEIKKALTNSGVVLVLVSKAYVESTWIQKEIVHLLNGIAQQPGRVVVPVYLPDRPNPLPQAWQFLEKLRGISILSEAELNDVVDQIKETLSRLGRIRYSDAPDNVKTGIETPTIDSASAPVKRPNAKTRYFAIFVVLLALSLAFVSALTLYQLNQKRTKLLRLEYNTKQLYEEINTLRVEKKDLKETATKLRKEALSGMVENAIRKARVLEETVQALSEPKTDNLEAEIEQVVDIKEEAESIQRLVDPILVKLKNREDDNETLNVYKDELLDRLKERMNAWEEIEQVLSNREEKLQTIAEQLDRKSTRRDRAREAWLKGVDAIKKESFDQAEAYLHKSIQLDGGFGPPYNTLGRIQLRRDNLEGAEQWFRKSLRNAPRYIPALNNLGVVMLRKGNLDEAEKQFRKALQLRPDYSTTVRNLEILNEKRKALRKSTDQMAL